MVDASKNKFTSGWGYLNGWRRDENKTSSVPSFRIRNDCVVLCVCVSIAKFWFILLFVFLQIQSHCKTKELLIKYSRKSFRNLIAQETDTLEWAWETRIKERHFWMPTQFKWNEERKKKREKNRHFCFRLSHVTMAVTNKNFFSVFE